jgi:hypothetical protein
MARMAVTRLLTGPEIMTIEDLSAEIVEVPEWGGFIRLLFLEPTPDTLRPLDELRGEDDFGDHPYARILSRLIVDEDGCPILTEDELRRCRLAIVRRLTERVLHNLDPAMSAAVEGISAPSSVPETRTNGIASSFPREANASLEAANLFVAELRQKLAQRLSEINDLMRERTLADG